jgi:integrase
MENSGASKSSCEKMLQLFGQLSDWAIREEIIQVNHARYVTIVAKQKSEGQVFSVEDIEAIKRSNLPAADIALVLLATGCRPNELFEASRDNCYPEYFVGGSKTESGRNRIIAVAPLGMESYTKILEASAGKEKLIEGYAGNKTYANFAKREFKNLMAEIGREGCTPYDCRHTFITEATRKNVDPQLLRRMVGHANLATTDKYYTHLDTEDILNAIKSV